MTLVLLVLTLHASSYAQNFHNYLKVIPGFVPLTDQTLSVISGTGFALTRMSMPARGPSNVVLWDEVARAMPINQKPVPGIRVIIKSPAQ